ncbi:4-hydroxyphenylpyruvate dioxygenase [Sorangium sp. So ce1097]|uniref:4-hydroxyphenylpyruvate dioxygenase n=1 Tax=Sorangium sp. So ce1097 TaxID=3133330 RepID=UPI003F5E1D7E
MVDHVRFERIAFVELYVRDAAEAAVPYVDTFGFETIAEAGPETGLDGHRSVLLGQGRLRLVLTASLTGAGPAAEYVRRHGDGVRDIAFLVEDAEAAFHRAVAGGARPVHAPIPCRNGSGRAAHATVGGVGDVVHSLVDRDGGAGVPCWFDARSLPAAPAGSFTDVDHIAFCLEPESLESIVDFYERAFGFSTSHTEYVETGVSGMSSKVVQNENGQIKFPLQEPLPGKAVGQIAEYLRLHDGPGVQHIALQTEDIIDALLRMRQRGARFMETPGSYYEALPGRVGPIDEDIRTLRDLDVLVDRDRWGYLLQIFTRSHHERRTLFFEVIERKHARGFGSENIRALFEAAEREYGRLGA